MGNIGGNHHLVIILHYAHFIYFPLLLSPAAVVFLRAALAVPQNSPLFLNPAQTGAMRRLPVPPVAPGRLFPFPDRNVAIPRFPAPASRSCCRSAGAL